MSRIRSKTERTSRARRSKPRAAGRPAALTPDVQARLCAELRRAKTVAESCRAVGIAESTFYGWVVRGERGEAPFSEFVEVVRRAKAERLEALEDNVVRLGRKDWRASFALMQAYAPSRFAPRVRLHIEQELRTALDRLEAEFAGAPEILERALAAVAGNPRSHFDDLRTSDPPREPPGCSDDEGARPESGAADEDREAGRDITTSETS